MLIEKSPQPALQQNKKTVSIWFRILANLTFWVLIAIIAGVVLGSYAPATAVKMEIIGKTFIDIIKLFIAPIIFLTIVLGISGMGDLKKVGRIGLN
jgi:aerobic C4-dicarboxylate transport protein